MPRELQLIEALIQALTFMKGCVEQQNVECTDLLKEAMLPMALELFGFSFDPHQPAYIELFDDLGIPMTLEAQTA